MINKKWILLIYLSIFLSIACLSNKPKDTEKVSIELIQTSDSTSTTFEGNELSPFLGLSFSKKNVEYPENWPQDMTYPQEFELLNITSGKSYDNTKVGWSLQHRYKGSIDDVIKNIYEFYLSKGWIIYETYPLDSGGITQILTKSQNESCLIVADYDSQQPDHVIIITTFTK